MPSLNINVSLSSRPKLAFVRWCWDWSKEDPEVRPYIDAGKVNPNGVSAPTKGEIGRLANSVQRTTGLPDCLRMVETPYTVHLSERGWPEFTKTIWRMLGLSLLEIATYYQRMYQTDRAYNNKQEDAQDAIAAAGAVLKIGDLTNKGREIETLRGDGYAPDPEKINPWTYPWFFFLPTNSKRDLYVSGLMWGKEDIVEPFYGPPLWLPLLSPTGSNWVEESKIRVLADNEPIPSPYHS